ncbi:hypothetical protein BO70DRAFT_391984 [Aspergillus heteromorphus CBS 117.55]|uniref:AMP-activated protein kinase glycogen-binding domain-containing protein n=1 Tax=Aspergillus heteromorphus CBS 117.55 TaxID=1448321 RepID=A0A317X1V7_9EURO|nr:uncharacterized protein BO70DRAFT_391984 [Aspergillus heteromorphus CBS 117.55]PWY92589.1 hypothetical protein BO70DRAFT_391984 [Aspergillus heteromorphus CBS 117.55]
MGSYTFKWPYDANEVFVTGTFDDWGKTVRLDRIGDGFEKEVSLPPTDEKVLYKFVVDGIWTTDNQVSEEDDGSNNINNVLYPDQIQTEPSIDLQNGVAAMSGVTPDSTTAALAAGIPKESSSKQNGYYPTISSAAPGSTTAGLGQDVPLEQRANVPGSYPATPATEAQKFSVNPIPASSGIGNPIKLNPGEKVPDPNTFNPNTLSSTVRTDKAGYDQGASASALAGSSTQGDDAFSVPPVSKNMIPESSLPMGEGAGATDPTSYTIQSAAPTSTTAGLAAAVPLESQKQTTSALPARDVPDVVKQSISEAHKDPEAAANEEVVEEKKEMESELQHKVHLDNSAGTPAPALTAATTDTAPRATGAEPASAPISPRATPADKPTVTTGVGAAQVPEVSGPGETEPSAAKSVDSGVGSGTTDDKTVPPVGATDASAAKTAEPKQASGPTAGAGAGAGAAGAASKPAASNNGAANGKEQKKKKKGFFARLKEKLK